MTLTRAQSWLATEPPRSVWLAEQCGLGISDWGWLQASLQGPNLQISRPLPWQTRSPITELDPCWWISVPNFWKVRCWRLLPCRHREDGNNNYDVTKEGATKGTMKFYQGWVHVETSGMGWPCCSLQWLSDASSRWDVEHPQQTSPHGWIMTDRIWALHWMAPSATWPRRLCRESFSTPNVWRIFCEHFNSKED